jgi:plasmid maintenance system antidote protein VapI
MTLDEYLKSGTDSAKSLANRVGTTEATISRIRKGEQNFTLDLARRIEVETGGSVSLVELAEPRKADAA